MFQALKNFLVDSENNVITKEGMLAVNDAMFTAISKTVIPSFKDVLDEPEFFNKENSNIVFLENLGGQLELRTNNPKDVVIALRDFFKDALVEERNLAKLIDKNMSDKIFPKLATVQELAIMKTISDLSSVTLYALDLLYYVMLPKDTDYPKAKVEELRNRAPSFTSIIRVYINVFDKHVKALAKVAKTVVKSDAQVSLVDKMLSKHGTLTNLPMVNGFINNPIYHIRLWFVDRDIDKYEALKEKKKLIELKLLDLKMQATGKHDEKLAKQISYYEDKVSGMEYDIRDLE